MGLVLDPSVLIAAEREKRGAVGSVSQLLASLSAEYSETEFLLSSISVMELEHGWHRANTPEAAAKRRLYLDEVLSILPVEPFTREMGVLAAKIDAEMKKGGLVRRWPLHCRASRRHLQRQHLAPAGRPAADREHG